MSEEKITIRDYDAAEFLEDEEMISMYLQEAFNVGTDAMKKKAISNVMRARYMTELSEKMGIPRRKLFELLTNEEVLDSSFTQRFLDVLGVSISAV